MQSQTPTPVAGVSIVELTPHKDDRGTVVEIFRQEWPTGISPVQWNIVHSQAGVLRGVHAHFRHADYLMVVHGMAWFGLHDLRPDSITEGVSCVIAIQASGHQALIIPPGVAHGFYFPAPATTCYAVSTYWDPADELGCRWDDPDLGIAWPDVTTPTLSDRDRQLGSLAELRSRIQPML